MYLTKTIKVHNYDTSVKVIVSDCLKTVNKLYKKYNTGMIYKDPLEGFMLSISINTYYLIIDQNYLTYNTILHELYHLTKAVTTDRSVFEEESQAWFQGYIGQKIMDFLKSKKVVVG